MLRAAVRRCLIIFLAAVAALAPAAPLGRAAAVSPLDLAWQAWERGDPDTTAYWAEQAGETPEALCLRALEAARHNSPGLVRYCLQKAAEAGVIDGRAALALGWVQCYLGEPDQAAEALARARDTGDAWLQAASLEGEAYAWLQAGKPARAWRLAKGFARLRPDSAAAWALLGDVALEFHDARLAAAMYRRALALSPGHPRSMAGQATAMLLSGDADAAWTRYRAVLDQELTDPRAAVFALAGAAAVLLARGEEGLAREILSTISAALAPLEVRPHLHAPAAGFVPRASSVGDAALRYVLPPALARAAGYCSAALAVAGGTAEPSPALVQEQRDLSRLLLPEPWRVLLSRVDSLAWGMPGTF